MIADTLGGRGSVTGVDLSEERVSACRNIIRKYKAQSCRLFRGDATSFCELPPQADDQVVREKGSQRQRARKRAKQQQQGEHTLVWSSCPQVWAKGGEKTSRSEQGAAGQAISEGGQAHGAACQQLYDRVLVDAECTHDGSIKHIAKFREGGWGQFEAKFLSRLNDLEGLQRGLLRQGFRLVKPGGVLVYSTCSMTRAQNEDVVEWLLREEVTATVVEIEQARGWPCRPGGIQHSVRLDPKTSETSALFICKLVKRVST
uniref:SAM-dependent MTase RsmB/NOP-type domain-containing protein n=1 Tax=Tetraselmis chuii TaxID=63592 RepID=A0A7S1SPF9_9CHLO|mmetsp:Transcript_22517/g.40092  ORF Transcript_22517/g.40092 Transcript_22517/m.40092 type:complete len:259 (+) Transcript_22517:276-1052(+)